jgi:hypothetical protein
MSTLHHDKLGVGLSCSVPSGLISIFRADSDIELISTLLDSPFAWDQQIHSMKRPLIATALALFATLTANARIGETQQEIATRYGEGRKSGDRLKAPGAETWKYSAGGFSIEVVYVNGKSVWELFERKDKVITDDDIKDLLKVNGAPGTNWRFDRRENRWERGGKPKLVAYREHGHPDFFSIRNPEAEAAAGKHIKLDKSGF